MAKMIQVRNVPERLHRELSRRARLRGQTLTQYIEEILERETSRPERDELFERLTARQPVKISRPLAELVREERR